MNHQIKTKTNDLVFGSLAPKFLGLGIALTSVIVTTSSAQAASLGWSNGTSDFYFPESEIVDNHTFSVTFSPDSIGLIGSATDEFTNSFTAAPPPYIQNLTTPAVGNFQFVDRQGSRFFYELTSDLAFSFDNGVSVTWPDNTVVVGEYDETGSIQFQLSNRDNTIPTVNGVPNLGPIAPTDVLQFGDSNLASDGGYNAQVDSVPEPTTILGSLAVLGLSARFKRKRTL